MLRRRGLLGGLFGGLLAMPAIVRTPGLLMPVKPVADDGLLRTSEIVLVGGFHPPQLFAWGDSQRDGQLLINGRPNAVSGLPVLVIDRSRPPQWWGDLDYVEVDDAV